MMCRGFISFLLQSTLIFHEIQDIIHSTGHRYDCAPSRDAKFRTPWPGITLSSSTSSLVRVRTQWHWQSISSSNI